VLSNTQTENAVNHVVFKEYTHLKTYMLDALEGYSHTLFEISFKLYWDLIRKICTGHEQEAFFLLKRNLSLVGPLMTLIYLSNLIRTSLLMALNIFLFLETLKMAKNQLLFLLIRKILWA